MCAAIITITGGVFAFTDDANVVETGEWGVFYKRRSFRIHINRQWCCCCGWWRWRAATRPSDDGVWRIRLSFTCLSSTTSSKMLTCDDVIDTIQYRKGRDKSKHYFATAPSSGWRPTAKDSHFRRVDRSLMACNETSKLQLDKILIFSTSAVKKRCWCFIKRLFEAFLCHFITLEVLKHIISK